MKTKAEAIRIVVEAAAATRTVEAVPPSSAFGRTLAEDARSDVDLPPFEKSSMDGYAVRAQDLSAAPAELRVLGAIHAGGLAPGPVGAGETYKIMTGAALPDGADAVAIVEDSEPRNDGRSVVLRRSVRPWQNVCRRGEDARKGDVVVPKGAALDAVALALLASVGVDPVPTFRPPRVSVIPTGDELVAASGPPPAHGKIRESNGLLLESQIRQVSPAIPIFRPGIARDSDESLSAFLDVGLDHDVLILSGGVSMGDLDLVGGALARRGLSVLIEKVDIKPGKPLLFGVVSRGDGGRCAVFGLPGNPVSAFATFEIFVRPYLLAVLGRAEVAAEALVATLDADRALKVIPRMQHLPAELEADAAGRLVARPLPWNGSADLRALLLANAFIVVPPDAAAPMPGDRVAVERFAGRAIKRADS